MSAVQIPEEFAVWVCYVTLALPALALTPTAFLHLWCVRTTWCNWANYCWKRLPVFQRKDTDRIWWSWYEVLNYRIFGTIRTSIKNWMQAVLCSYIRHTGL